MKKALFGILIAAMAAFCEAASPANGSYIGKAISLKASQAVTLVNEYDPDPDIKEFYDTGVCYYKIKLTKGAACTIWIVGGSAIDMSLSVDVNPNDEDWPFASFESEEYDGGATKAAFLYADSWDEDDPNSYTFYVQVSGDIGQQTTLYYSQGIVSFTRVGEESSPKRLTFGDSQISDKASLIGGDYYYIAKLTEGRKYMVRTTGGTASAPLSIVVEPAGDYDLEIMPDYVTYKDNAGIYIYPEITQDYVIKVEGAGDVLSQDFTLKYRAFPSRLPGEHESSKLYESKGYETEIVPGRRVADTDYYDEVIDESLTRVKLPAGQKWAFETEGATNALKMVIYDTYGNILRENQSKDGASQDVRAVIGTTYDGWYYIGVCRPDLAYSDDAPTGGAIRLFAYNTESVANPDQYDSADDVYTGAELLDAYPASATTSVEEFGPASGEHILNADDWYDWFSIPARSGVTYALRASYAGSDTTELTLRAKVYRMVNGSLSSISTVGSISPGGTEESVKALTFTADQNGMFYVRVNVNEGLGLDFPAFRLHSVAYTSDGSSLGLVQIKTKGADGSWWITEDASAVYPNGSILALPANVTKNIRFKDVSGFTTPPKTPITPTEWTGYEDSITCIYGVYNDTSDPADDIAGNAALNQIFPTRAGGKVKRTLWAEDPADYMRFKAEEGYYYSFWLEDTTLEGDGDAVFSIAYYTDMENPVVENATSYMKKAFDPREKGKYNLWVSHGTDPAVDSSYRLRFNAFNVGTISFQTTTPNVSESADYVDVAVNRTGGEGVVKVNFATEEYTAKPGKNYYPTSGVLEWADGDTETKYIRVRLIPDLREEWDIQLRFRLRLWAMSEDSLADDEFPAVITTDTATVKIKEISAKTPGTIVVDSPNAVVAGENVRFYLGREDGSDGRVAVLVKTQPGTAQEAKDYVHESTVLVWEDGESGYKTFDVSTKAVGAAENKVFNIKLTAQTTDEYAGCETPDIPERKFYVTIGSELVARDFAAVKRSLSASYGIDAAVTSGVWYEDFNGMYRCVAPAVGLNAGTSFTVTGPGLFVVVPTVKNGKGDFKWKTQNGSWTTTESGKKLVIPVIAGYGEKSTIYFKINGTDGSAYAEFTPPDSDSTNPFCWMSFADIVPIAPKNADVVDASSMLSLNWGGVFGTEDLYYRVHLGRTSSERSPVYATVDKGTLELAANTLAVGQQYKWRLEVGWGDSAESAQWLSLPVTWAFKTVAGTPVKTVLASGYTDVSGMDMSMTAGRIKLAQGVLARFYVASDSGSFVSASVVDGELPPGLELKATSGRIKGVPTKGGIYKACVQVVASSGEASVMDLVFDVADINTAAGTFTGMLKESGSALETGYPRIGRITGLNISSDGKISATTRIAGVKYNFAADSFDSVALGTAEKIYYGPEDVFTVTVVSNVYESVLLSPVTIGGDVYTNKLELSVLSVESDNVDMLFHSAGTAKMTLHFDTEDGAQEVVYAGELVRDNSAIEEWVEWASDFEGYYTVSLVPANVDPADGVPCGNGYLTFQIDGKGNANYAGLLADGTAVSGSSRIAIRDDADAILVPIGIYGDSWSFGGMVKFVLDYENDEEDDDFIPVYVDSRSALEWNKDGVKSSFDGDGFRLEIRPTGGWYNKLVNLQTYYLDRDFSIEAQPVEGLPANMLPSGCTYTSETMPYGVSATLGRYGLTATARSLKTDASTGLYDLAASVNPWKVNTSFVMETGILTGTFRAWSDDGKTQSQFATLNHYSVLLMNRDKYTPLDNDVWTSGFYLLPVTSDWTLSMPFNIKAVKVDRDWTEAEVPIVE